MFDSIEVFNVRFAKCFCGKIEFTLSGKEKRSNYGDIDFCFGSELEKTALHLRADALDSIAAIESKVITDSCFSRCEIFPVSSDKKFLRLSVPFLASY